MVDIKILKIYNFLGVIMEMLNFEIEQRRVFDKIGKNNILALATSNKNYVTVRMVSIIVYRKKIYFQTGIDLEKYKQICENENVALCFENIQMEGIAKILGKPENNEKIIKLYKKYFQNSHNTYSKLDKEVLVEIIVEKIKLWEYDFDRKPYQIFLELKNKKAYKEMYLK